MLGAGGMVVLAVRVVAVTMVVVMGVVVLVHGGKRR